MGRLWRCVAALMTAAGAASCHPSGTAGSGRAAGSAVGAAASALAGSAAMPGQDGGSWAVEPVFDPDVELYVAPPAGWRLDTVRRTSRDVHKTWVSPTGDTAYGVIRFRLPLPVTDDLALWGFLREMRRAEGEARLLEREAGYVLPSGLKVLRFTAEGGQYRVRTVMVNRGLGGWCVYAGTLRGRPVREDELAVALRHRDALALPGMSAGEQR
ncbi:MAG: hypothetical protein ACK4PI_14075 [Tepidisphaerales bacterium]